MAQHRQSEVEFVVHNSPSTFTGIGRYIRELYKHLLPRVPVRLTSTVGPPFASRLAFLHQLPRGISEHRAGNLVHFTQILGCSQMLWQPVQPAIATVHDLGAVVCQAEARSLPPWDRFLLRLSLLGLKRMDAIITVSEYSRRDVIRHLGIPPQRVFAIHSGNDGNLFRPVNDARAQLETRYGIPNSPKHTNLIYVGSESPRKNLATLLKAMKLLPPEVRLLKVGSAGGVRYRESTEKVIAELGLGGRVFFFEEVPDEDLPLLYSAADVYVCSSLVEGFGHPILEAMACGTPVVCSNAASLPEIAGDGAVLVPPSDDQAFAKAVTAILSNDALREQMVQLGLQRAAAFSWEQAAEAAIAVYQRVIRGYGGQRARSREQPQNAAEWQRPSDGR